MSGRGVERAGGPLALAMDYGACMEACAAYCASARPLINGPEEAGRLMLPLARGLAQEVFWVLLLDIKKRLIGAPVECYRGLINQCPIHPREVFRAAIVAGAARIVLAHNHPSGDPTPSQEDLYATQRLAEAGRLLGVPVIDHVIIGRPGEGGVAAGYVSLREKNLVAFEE